MELYKTSPLEMAIIPRSSDIGGFEVKRALPFRDRRLVGPFIFWDQMGPGEFLAGQGLDVRPHPHIGLSTVTYLFDGEIDHRDSLGTFATINPGDINLMSAGRGIVHSERTGASVREKGSNLYGIQSWLAQPLATENSDPNFANYTKDSLPLIEAEGKHIRLLMGSAYGATSPIKTDWDTLYADITLEAGAELPIPTETEERALYVLSGEIMMAGIVYQPEQMLILKQNDDVVIRALTPVRMMMLGGAVMDGPRYIYWNFVASSKERLEQAKEDWRQQNAQSFPKVAGDDQEFIQLP
jgi:redox-sensitive bicupin YhaK (pirin superfamily)